MAKRMKINKENESIKKNRGTFNWDADSWEEHDSCPGNY